MYNLYCRKFREAISNKRPFEDMFCSLSSSDCLECPDLLLSLIDEMLDDRSQAQAHPLQ